MGPQRALVVADGRADLYPVGMAIDIGQWARMKATFLWRVGMPSTSLKPASF
jgi:hypothetical protein